MCEHICISINMRYAPFELHAFEFSSQLLGKFIHVYGAHVLSKESGERQKSKMNIKIKMIWLAKCLLARQSIRLPLSKSALQ